MKSMSTLHLFLLFFCLSLHLSAQPSIQWQITLGGTLYDEAKSVQQTTDGGYFIAGYTVSYNFDVTNNHGFYDFWAVKLDSMGIVQWKKTYGGSSDDWAYDAKQTIDGGYILTGYTESNDGDVSGNHGDKDVWVLKLAFNGDIEWQKCLGGSSRDEASSIQLTNDGGYILAGSSSSTDGDVSGNHGSLDYWVVKLNHSGSIEWQKSLGGSSFDFGYSVAPTNDGGYIVAGESQSNDGDVSGNQIGLDVWVIKLNFEGKIEWQKELGGSGLDRANDIHQTREGGFVVFGQTSSNDGDVSGNHGNGYDFWVVKLNNSGAIEWQKALGGSGEDYGQSICQTTDGGFVATGYVNSINGDVTNNHGSTDLWVVKLTEGGELQWQKAFGGTLQETGFALQQTNDGGYIISGYAWSNNGDVSGVKGKADFWVVKLSPESSPTTTPTALPLEIYPNPATHTISLQVPRDQATAAGETPLYIRITDLLGQEISQQTLLPGKSLDIAALPNGMYALTATDALGKVFSGRFVKQD
jgi:hypothetical protein